ncbi:hypothetical protein LS684_23385 (plasmid) [Cytobacillus spongiae]|nr:hypothetical protein [Cytobacillus spongiae]MCA1062931.1 hypothetical protein [Rossellomorea aquimaris]NMH70264.1 hypothetical protein [Bacillus sp. RO3]UII58534.1 hypothetical protein LS684_23385 [Cytobacillus spongiae]WJV28441.1 hypothetical protein QTG56_15240 [Rossellomorea sp. AcN35-11]
MKNFNSKKVIQYSYLFHKIGILDNEQLKQIEEYHGSNYKKRSKWE